jgi:hypothetical protein
MMHVDSRAIDFSNLPRDTRVEVTSLLGRCSCHLRKSFAGANMCIHNHFFLWVFLK